MHGQTTPFSDIQERLQELGSSTRKKTTGAVKTGVSGAVNKAFEVATGNTGGLSSQEQGSGANHTPLPGHLIEAAHAHKDDQDLARVRSQLAQYQDGEPPKTNEKQEFQNFFRKYKEEEESYQHKLKRQVLEKKQEDEKKELEMKKREEQEREKEQAQSVPQGKQRRNIFAKVKKRSSMIETKASAGKQ